MRSIKIDSVPMDELWKRNSERHGWCDITPLSGDMEENIFMATFADDYRVLFEANDGEIRLLLTKDQEFNWSQCTEEENQWTMEEILLFYLQDKIDKED